MNRCHWLYICVYLAHYQMNFKYVEIYKHNSTGAGMNENILNMCQDCGLPLIDSRSKRYDNGSHMWGKHCDFQTRILTLNQWVLFCSLYLTLIDCDDQWRSQMLYQSSNISNIVEHLNFFYHLHINGTQNLNSFILKSYFQNPQGQLHRSNKTHQVSREKII